MLVTPTPQVFQTLAERYDSALFEPSGASRRVRLTVSEDASWDALLVDGGEHMLPAACDADAPLTADARTWGAIAQDGSAGMRAYLSGRLAIRRNLHLGVGFLAATSGHEDPARLRFRMIATRRARLSTLEAGSGPPVVAVHGLGGTKGSFLPTVAALAGGFRVIALDLPGLGDSDKPLAAPYDARYFAAIVVDLLDALDIECAHLIGNSLGGRVALEVGMRHPDRAGRSVLLAPSLAWKRHRTLAPLLRVVRPELGLIQFTPRSIVETIAQRLIPGADDGWAAAGVDEFLRAFLTPAGRSAFYAAARHIYLETPNSSSTADTSRRSSGRGRRTRRSARSSGREEQSKYPALGRRRGRSNPVERDECWRALYAVPAGVSAVRREPHGARGDDRVGRNRL